MVRWALWAEGSCCGHYREMGVWKGHGRICGMSRWMQIPDPHWPVGSGTEDF